MKVPRYNKRGLNWSLMLGGFVFFTMIMFAGTSLIGDMTLNYGVDTEGQFDNTFNELSELANVTSSMSQTLQTGIVEESDIFTTVSRNAFAALKILFAMPSILITILGEIGEVAGFPYWFLPIVVLIITLSFGIMVLMAFMKARLDDS